jgi:putative oxidoreductase
MVQDLLIRLMVGTVFLFEGVQKFIRPGEMGPGRFARLGIPYPDATGNIVGAVEVICAALILIGTRVRAAVWPLFVVIAGAIYYTKIPLIGQEGLLKAMHDSRTDYCMVIGLIYLATAYWHRGKN